MSTFTADELLRFLELRWELKEYQREFIKRLHENPTPVLYQLPRRRPSLRTGDIIKFKGGPE